MLQSLAHDLDRQATRSDIINRDSIVQLVHAFYTRVRSDPLLQPIFERQIGGAWDSHLETMVAFWESVLFRAGTFRGNPPLKHRLIHQQAPLTAQHFERWLALFQCTLEENFEGPNTIFASRAAHDIAAVLQRKLQPESLTDCHSTTAEKPKTLPKSSK